MLWNPTKTGISNFAFSELENGRTLVSKYKITCIPPSLQYENMFFTIHNVSIGFGLPLTYATFYLLMSRKVNLISNHQQEQKQQEIEERKRRKNVGFQTG